METTNPIWLTVLLSVASALISVGGVLLSQKMTNRRETERSSHEERIKQLELEEMKQKQLRDERIKAYINFAKQTSAKSSLDNITLPELWEAFTEIQMVAGSQKVADAAYNLYTSAREVKELNAAPEEHNNYEQKAIVDDIVTAKQNFLKVAREDIGHPPESADVRL